MPGHYLQARVTRRAILVAALLLPLSFGRADAQAPPAWYGLGVGIGLLRAEGVAESGPFLTLGLARRLNDRSTLGADLIGWWMKSATVSRAQYLLSVVGRLYPSSETGMSIALGVGGLHYRSRFGSELRTRTAWVGRAQIAYDLRLSGMPWVRPYVERGLVLSYSGSGDFWAFWHLGASLALPVSATDPARRRKLRQPRPNRELLLRGLPAWLGLRPS
jgi:hypothetical protein